MVSLVNRQSLWIKVRIWILMTGMLIGAGAVARAAWDLGITRSDELRGLAREQYTRRITLPARRGMITDRHGEELAIEVEVDSIYANAREVANPAAAVAALAGVLDLSETALMGKLQSGRRFVWIRRRVGPTEAEKVRALALPGIHLLKESKRFYPARGLAAHVIGFAGIDSVGLEGIELKYDDQLRGRNDAVTGLRDARGRVVFSGRVFGPKGVVGSAVELTIDRTLQHIVEQELAATARTFNAKAGHAVIMEPYTGEVLALANWPGYNPNAINSSVPEMRRNRAVLDVFEPGSTFKIFTMAAALNSSAIRPDELTYCERGRMEMFDTVIHDDHRDGWLNPTQCLKRSSNICIAKIALKLGKKKLYHYLRRFGFGESTGADLPFESRGILHHHRKWYDIDAATISFGQGVGVTGLQLAAALSAIANGGVLMRPLFVKRIVGPDKETIMTFAPESRRRVISRYTARLIGDMMTAVTEEGGTGTEGALEGFLMAGKTGTAQKSSAGIKGYHSEKWIASFIGFIPAHRPRLAITVVLDEPLISHYGGTVAAPALRRIADKALRYLGVAPREKKRRASGKKKVSVESEKKAPEKIVRSRFPDEPSRSDDSNEAAIEPGSNQVLAPDLTGMTMKQAMEALVARDLRPLFMGTGFGAKQTPLPGAPVDRGAFVRAHFEPPGHEAAPETAPETTAREDDAADHS